MKLMWNAFALLCLALCGSSMALSRSEPMSENDIATAACRMAGTYNRIKFVYDKLNAIYEDVYRNSTDLFYDANRLDAVDPNAAASAQKAAGEARQARIDCDWSITKSRTHLRDYMKTLESDLPELKGNGHDHFEQVHRDCYEFGLYRAHERNISKLVENNRGSLFTWGADEQKLWKENADKVTGDLADTRNQFSRNFDDVRRSFENFVKDISVTLLNTLAFNLDKATKKLDEAQQLYKKALEKVVQNAVKKCQAGGASAEGDGGAKQPNCEKINEKVNEIMKKREQANLKGADGGVQSESGSTTTAAGSSSATQAVPDSSAVVDITADDIDSEMIEAVTGPVSSAQKSHVSTTTLLAVVIPCTVLLLGAVMCFALWRRSTVKKDPVAL